jgi:hypothetical protein
MLSTTNNLTSQQQNNVEELPQNHGARNSEYVAKQKGATESREQILLNINPS